MDVNPLFEVSGLIAQDDDEKIIIASAIKSVMTVFFMREIRLVVMMLVFLPAHPDDVVKRMIKHGSL